VEAHAAVAVITYLDLSNPEVVGRYLLLTGLSFLIGPDDTAVAFQEDYLEKNGPGLLMRST
jgi:hypothetical protein